MPSLDETLERPTFHIEQFDAVEGRIVTHPAPPAITVLDIMGGTESTEGGPYFVDMRLYDVSQTVINALHNLGRRYPNSYAVVFGYLSDLKRIAAQEYRVTPLV